MFVIRVCFAFVRLFIYSSGKSVTTLSLSLSCRQRVICWHINLVDGDTLKRRDRAAWAVTATRRRRVHVETETPRPITSN